MYRLVNRFLKNSDGNATIEWIVITSAIVALGLTVVFSISTPANDVATNVNTSMNSVAPALP